MIIACGYILRKLKSIYSKCTAAYQFVKENSLGMIEVAILDLIKTLCGCSVEDAKFHNSNTSCSGGNVTFSSTLAHASDDGTVTATVLIETFKAGLSKEDYSTITFYGQELVVFLPVDDDCNSSSTTLPFLIGFASAMLVAFMACIIIITCR